jgi:cell filamentation protein
MFGDLLPGIAGKIRDVDVQATGTGIPYCRPEFIDANLTTLFQKLDRENYLTGLDANTFADRLADRWGELSAIHPYRDGNTRSQSTYVSAIAERAGHPIDWERVDVDELRTFRLQAVAGNDRPLAGYLREHLVDTDRAAAADTDLSGSRISAQNRTARIVEAGESGLDAFEREDRRLMRAAGIDPDEPTTSGSGGAPTSSHTGWAPALEQSRDGDGLER